jgi:D-alanyl-D-alanine carboxypeptidase (penicillin-binding protein 5/6)
VAEGLESGGWVAETPIVVSALAQAMGGTQLYLEAGETWPLEELMQAIAVASANDAALAVAEGLWGSKADYLQAANERVRTLGMSDTVIRSVHGLPPDPGELPDETTARDMATLARACVQNKRILTWSKIQSLQLRPEGNEFHNTNKLLGRVEGCDGLKTGYIRAAGYCITATAERDGVRLVCVVMGAERLQERFDRAAELLEAGFARTRRTEEDTTQTASQDIPHRSTLGDVDADPAG